ncbi:MAG: hypothetical protein ACTHXJ_07825 [Mesonia sp.]|uniref:hypothetical protein n=1 Tax=Mesonia sp. TaxID=1960830 RepID=UPI003F9432D3
MLKHIQSYLERYPRNKLVIHQEDMEMLNAIDIGEELSLKLKPILKDRKLAMKTMQIIDDLLAKSIQEHKTIGNYIALKNIGILLEPELKLNLLQLFDTYSSSQTLFVYWDGEIENDQLYFLSKKNGQKFNLNTISHITL